MLENYLIIHKSILPEYYEKVLQARRLMESGKVKEVSQAVRQVGISRSTYYKYKDYIIEPSAVSGDRRAVLSMMLDHEPGVLSALLAQVSEAGASVLTIAQSPPVHGQASVTLSLSIGSMEGPMAALMENIKNTAGVENLRLLAVE